MMIECAKLRQLAAEIETLAADRAIETCEQHEPNDYYGHAKILKEFAGLPADQPLRFGIQHGIRIDLGMWPHDYHGNHFCGVVHSRWRAEVVSGLVAKHITPIGPYIHYAPPLWSQEEIQQAREQLGRTLLVFPAHSTHHLDVDFDVDAFCDSLAARRGEFSQIVICVYWRDVQRGLHREYSKRGFPCVTAGHMYDPQFLPRLRALLEFSSATLSNEVGTHLGYSLYLNRPAQLLAMQTRRSATQANRMTESTAEKRLEMPKYRELFAPAPDRITEEQRDFIGKYWGFSDVKTAPEIRALAKEAADRYERGQRRRIWRQRLGPLAWILGKPAQ